MECVVAATNVGKTLRLPSTNNIFLEKAINGQIYTRISKQPCKMTCYIKEEYTLEITKLLAITFRLINF